MGKETKEILKWVAIVAWSLLMLSLMWMALDSGIQLGFELLEVG